MRPCSPSSTGRAGGYPVSDPITPWHAARILMRAAGADGRDPSPLADEVWASALTRAGVAYRDCLDAVDEHYARTSARAMPADIAAIARELSRDRQQRAQAREAIEAADRPGVLPPGEFHAKLTEAIEVARRSKARRADKIPHPSGDDGGEGMAWDPQPQIRRTAPTGCGRTVNECRVCETQDCTPVGDRTAWGPGIGDA